MLYFNHNITNILKMSKRDVTMTTQEQSQSGVIGGGVDAIGTKTIADKAIDCFINNASI